MSTAPAVAFALLALAAREPRLALVEAQLAGRPDEALAVADAWRAAEPAGAAAAGVDVLRGVLLAGRGRTDEARAALGAALGGRFDPWARLELARLEVAAGRGDAAVALQATLLAHGPPPALVSAAVDELTAAFLAPRDCRALAVIDAAPLPAVPSRRLALPRADCLLAAGETAAAKTLLGGLLDQRDGVDLAAADRLLSLEAVAPTGGEAQRFGLLLFAHRDFSRALPLLETALVGRPQRHGEMAYARARSLFWLGRYPEAEARFLEIASTARAARDRADALYQAGRSAELAGRSNEASAHLAACAVAEPGGSWAAACHLSRLRLAFRADLEAQALEAYAALAGRRDWAETHGRAALFLASSDLVRGRSDRARSWLDAASGSAPRSEVAYWRGRLAELRGDPGEAIARYRDALLADPWDPFGRAARERLTAPPLADPSRAAFARLAASGERIDLLASLRLAGSEDEAARGSLRRSWSADAGAAVLTGLSPPPAAAWPLWADPEPHPGAHLVALGLWRADPDVLVRVFPAAPAVLAMTRAHLLAEADRSRESVRLAEALAREAPEGFPEELLSPALRRLLYPRPFQEAVRREAAVRGVEPLLLTALMREESRFDPDAVSSSGAHGLTQFVLPTAQRLAAAIGRERIDLAGLHQPDVAIALGAAYLAELDARFAGEPAVILAAYNAGEPQAALWKSYCFSGEAPEYVSKIGFRQTRDYVRKVLRGWEVYRELYGGR